MAEKYRAALEAKAWRAVPVHGIQHFMDKSPRLARLGLNNHFFILNAQWGVFASHLGPFTHPVSLKAGLLKVRCPTPVLRQELTYATAHILAVAKDYFGEGAVIAVKAVA